MLIDTKRQWSSGASNIWANMRGILDFIAMGNPRRPIISVSRETGKIADQVRTKTRTLTKKGMNPLCL